MFTNPVKREEILLRTKLSPPQLHRRVLPRPALAAHLREALDYRLAIVQAGTGYSKTTALAALASGGNPLFWYTVGEADLDPRRFLSYLIAAFRLKLPALSDLPQALLQEPAGEPSQNALDALLNALHNAVDTPSLLVIDDFHLVSHSPEINALLERFVAYAPPDLHVIISTRYPLNWESLLAWRVRGDVLEVNREALAFRPPEIEALFRDIYGITLAPAELAAIADRTEGWPIALQLVWQGLRDAPSRRAASLVSEGSASLSALFDYLAHDVLGAQSPEVASFLRDTAVLRELTPASCDAVTSRPGSAALLDRLLDLDLFVLRVGEGHFRYHHLFHDFLRQQTSTDPAALRARHGRAAEHFESSGDYEEAIYHWLQALDLSRAAGAVEKAGEVALRAGWLDTVARWIDALPPDVLSDHPLLQAYLADIYRLRSRFDEALAWYAQAERTWRERHDPAGVSRALRGQASVYLDTVRPAQAETYLQEALRLNEAIDDRESRARLLELLAENKLNMGKPHEAERLRAGARALRQEGPGEDALSVRVKLRTGKLDEAQRALEAWVETERRDATLGQVHPPRAHRETLLILSLIHSLRGQGERAFKLAEEGIALGTQLESPFVTAVGHARLGHAWQVLADPTSQAATAHNLQQANRCYQAATALGDQLAVRRIRAEVMWGMTRAYGFGGDLESARRAAAEGVDTGRWAGDAWIVALIDLMLGASLVLAGQPREAIDVLLPVLSGFRECADTFGRAAARLWLALAYHEAGQPESSAACMDEGLSLCEANGYDFLFTAPSLLGPPDPRRLVPLLLLARARRSQSAYVARLLSELGLPDIQAHPGYRLRVQTLGTFRTWRGTIELEPRHWQRDKARQLFQLLLTERGRWLQREEIVDRLWPDLAPDAAVRDFKVALNALNRALEPGRTPDAPFAFIVREGAAYRIRPEADLWLDATAFEHECHAGLKLAESGEAEAAVERLQAAARLYGGNFLPDTLYEDWTSAERERLLALYLRAADKLAGLLIQQGRYAGAIEICTNILAQDACWERAYRWLMLAHARQGDRPLALRTYQRCADTMRRELSMQPSQATIALYECILSSEDLPATVS